MIFLLTALGTNFIFLLFLNHLLPPPCECMRFVQWSKSDEGKNHRTNATFRHRFGMYGWGEKYVWWPRERNMRLIFLWKIAVLYFQKSPNTLGINPAEIQRVNTDHTQRSSYYKKQLLFPLAAPVPDSQYFRYLLNHAGDSQTTSSSFSWAHDTHLSCTQAPSWPGFWCIWGFDFIVFEILGWPIFSSRETYSNSCLWHHTCIYLAYFSLFQIFLAKCTNYPPTGFPVSCFILFILNGGLRAGKEHFWQSSFFTQA